MKVTIVSNNFLHSRNIFLEIGQAFAHCCELPQDGRKCCSCNFLIHHEVYGKIFISINLWILADGIANSGCYFKPLE